MLTVYGRKSSLNVQKVMWLVGELNLPHRHVELGGSFGGLNTLEFTSMNPHGRVPVIDDGGVTIWESHAILRYLAARYGVPDYWSEDPVERSYVDRWIEWAQSTLQPDFLVGIFWGYYRTPEEQRDEAEIAKMTQRTAAHFQLLDRVIAERPFLVGERLTLADIPIGTHLYRYFGIDIRRPSIPNVERWYNALQNRAAYREHVMIPFGELFGRLSY